METFTTIFTLESWFALLGAAIALLSAVYSRHQVSEARKQVQLAREQAESAKRQADAAESQNRQVQTLGQAEWAGRLLSEALRIQSDIEAWALDGENWRNASLTDHRGLPTTEPLLGGLWLRSVELRAVLDEHEWNSPADQLYGFIGHRRAWIVRNKLSGRYDRNDSGSGPSDGRPAVISSRGFEELAGWIEQVTDAHTAGLLTDAAMKRLHPLLGALCGAGRLDVFRTRITPAARAFLQAYDRAQPSKRE